MVKKQKEITIEELKEILKQNNTIYTNITCFCFFRRFGRIKLYTIKKSSNELIDISKFAAKLLNLSLTNYGVQFKGCKDAISNIAVSNLSFSLFQDNNFLVNQVL